MAEDILNQDELEQQVSQQEQPPKKLSVKDFASKIKSKYPEYNNIDDNLLTQKMLAKYPVYKDQVDFSEKKNEVQPLATGGQEQKPTGQPGTSPTQSPSQLPSTKVKWEENPLNPLAAVKKAQADKEAASKIMPQPTPTKKDWKDIVFDKTTFNKPVASDATYVRKQETVEQAEQVKTGRANMQLAIDNTTERALKAKGLPVIKNSPTYIKQRKKVEDAVLNGDASYTVDPTTKQPALSQTTGFWETAIDDLKRALNDEDESDEFINKMNTQQRAEYAKKKREEAYALTSEGYIGKKPSEFAGKAGGIIGGAIPFVTKMTAAGVAGAALVGAAPETFGASLAAIPAVLSAAFTMPSAVNQGGRDEVLRRFNELKDKNPDASDVELMKQAESGLYSGEIIGGLVNTLFAGLGSKALAPEAATVLEKSIANTLKNTAHTTAKAGLELGTISAGGTAAQEIEAGLENKKYRKNAEDIIEDISSSFAHGATAGVLLHTATKAALGSLNLTGQLYSAIKYGLSKENPAEIQGALMNNEILGNVPQGTTEVVMNDLNSYNKSLEKTSEDLTPITQASVAGLIQKRDKLMSEMASKDQTQIDSYLQQVDAINEQIKKITESNDPFAHEINDVTGQKLDGTIAEEPLQKGVEGEPKVEIPEQKPKEYDTENITGIPSKVGVGEEPVTTEPVKGGGAEKTGAGRVLQAPGAEGEGEGVEPKVGEEVIQKIPEEISSLKDDETITFRVKNIDEIPEEFRDRAVKKEGLEAEVRKKILGLPIGKKSKITFGEGYTYQLTGKEAKDYAESQLPKAELPQQKGEGVREVKTEAPKAEEKPSEVGDFKNIKLEMRYPERNEIIYVSPKRLLEQHAKDNPDFDVQKKENQIGNRVEKAKQFLIDYLKDTRLINRKTGERMNVEAIFEPSVVSIGDNGKLGFEDGRHRVLAAKELGIKEVPIEVPKEQAQKLKTELSEPTKPIREEVSGAVQPAPEVPKGQEIKTGVQPSAEPISGRRAEATPTVLEETKIPEHNKDNQPEFTTSNGRQKVNRLGDELVVTDSKTGKKVSRSTEKKAISEYINNFDFTHGEEGESTTISEDPNKTLEQVVETSSNPHQLAVIYAENNLPFAETIMDKNGMISEYGIGKISLDSFRRFGDINKLTPKIRANYIAKKGDIAESIDTYAKELSEHYFPDGDGTEISPQDIVDFMEKYESKKELRNKGKSQLLTDIEDKFKKLTGLKLTVEVANKAIEQKIQKESQLEQNLLKQDYENQQQLENEYWKQYKATDGFTKEVSPTEIDRGKEIIAKEGAKIETELPEQKEKPIEAKPIEIEKEEEKEIGGKKSGVKKAIIEPLRESMSLPKIELPKMGGDVEELQQAKERVDNGDSNPRKMVDEIINNERGYKDEKEVMDMQYYAHQLNAKDIELAKMLSEADTDVEKSAVLGLKQQLSDEIDRQTEAARIAGNKWGKIGYKMQPVIDEGFNISREKNLIKEAYKGEVPEQVKQKIEAITKERDEAIAEREKIEKKLTEERAKKEISKKQKEVESDKKSKPKKTKEDFIKERQNIIDKIKKKWKDSKGGGTMYSLVVPIPIEKVKQLAAISPEVGQLIKSHVEEGINKLEDIVDNVHNLLKDQIEGITKQDVLDLIGGKYNISKERDEAAKKVSQLRAEAKKLLKENATPDEKIKSDINRLNKKADNIEAKIKEGEAIKQQKDELNPYNNSEWIKADQRVVNAEKKMRELKRQAFESQKNLYQKGLMWAGRAIRLSILSGYNVLAKLGSAATIGSAIRRIPEQAIGSIYNIVFKGISEKAPIEGSSMSLSSDLKWYKEFFSPKKFVKNSWDILKSGTTYLNKKMGKGEYEHVPILYIPTDLHQIIKDPVKRATFEQARDNGLRWAAKQGLDINNDLVIQSIENAAFKRAEYEIFQESNSLTRKFTAWKNEMEKKGNVGATGKFVADFLIPISSVPTNIARRLGISSPFGLIKGYADVVKSYREGIEKLTPEQADKVMRQLKQGTLGTALWLIGWYGVSHFGGLYTRYNLDKRREDDELSSDEMEIGGKSVPKPVQHALPLEIIQLAATSRRLWDKYNEDSDVSTPEAIYKAGLGSIGTVAEQIPIIETPVHMVMATQDPYEGGKLKEDIEGRFKPQILKETGIIPKKTKEVVSEKDLELPEYKLYKDKGVNIPVIGSKNQIRIEGGVMNNDQYEQFSKLVNKYVKEGWEDEDGNRISSLSEIPQRTFTIKQKGEESEQVLGENLSKEDLQEKLSELFEKARAKAKEDLGLSVKKPKRTVTEEK